MGTTLTGATVAATYSGFIKTAASAALTSPVILSDGQGNDTALTLAPAGGASSFSGALTSLGNFTVGSGAFVVTAASGNITSTGSLTLTGGVTVNTNKFTVAAATGNTVIAGTLLTSGAATFSSTGAFSGNLSTSQTLTCRSFVQNDAAGSNALSGTLTVTGTATFNGSVQLNSSVSFAQTATFSAGITAPTFTATSSSSLGTASAGSLTTTGAVNVGGNLSVTGNATVNGNATLGDAAGDTLTINAATWTTPNVPSKATPIAADTILIRDSADTNKVKTALVSTIKPTVWDSGNISISGLYYYGNTSGVAQISGSHTLGVNPSSCMAYFECVSANFGYSVGDRIELSGVDTQTWGSPYARLSVNSSNWFLTTNIGGNAGQFLAKSAGAWGAAGTFQSFDNSKWNLRLFLTA